MRRAGFNKKAGNRLRGRARARQVELRAVPLRVAEASPPAPQTTTNVGFDYFDRAQRQQQNYSRRVNSDVALSHRQQDRNLDAAAASLSTKPSRRSRVAQLFSKRNSAGASVDDSVASLQNPLFRQNAAKNANSKKPQALSDGRYKGKAVTSAADTPAEPVEEALIELIPTTRPESLTVDDDVNLIPLIPTTQSESLTVERQLTRTAHIRRLDPAAAADSAPIPKKNMLAQLRREAAAAGARQGVTVRAKIKGVRNQEIRISTKIASAMQANPRFNAETGKTFDEEVLMLLQEIDQVNDVDEVGLSMGQMDEIYRRASFNNLTPEEQAKIIEQKRKNRRTLEVQAKIESAIMQADGDQEFADDSLKLLQEISYRQDVDEVGFSVNRMNAMHRAANMSVGRRSRRAIRQDLGIDFDPATFRETAVREAQDMRDAQREARRSLGIQTRIASAMQADGDESFANDCLSLLQDIDQVNVVDEVGIDADSLRAVMESAPATQRNTPLRASLRSESPTPQAVAVYEPEPELMDEIVPQLNRTTPGRDSFQRLSAKIEVVPSEVEIEMNVVRLSPTPSLEASRPTGGPLQSVTVGGASPAVPAATSVLPVSRPQTAVTTSIRSRNATPAAPAASPQRAESLPAETPAAAPQTNVQQFRHRLSTFGGDFSDVGGSTVIQRYHRTNLGKAFSEIRDGVPIPVDGQLRLTKIDARLKLWAATPTYPWKGIGLAQNFLVGLKRLAGTTGYIWTGAIRKSFVSQKTLAMASHKVNQNNLARRLLDPQQAEALLRSDANPFEISHLLKNKDNKSYRKFMKNNEYDDWVDQLGDPIVDIQGKRYNAEIKTDGDDPVKITFVKSNEATNQVLYKPDGTPIGTFNHEHGLITYKRSPLPGQLQPDDKVYVMSIEDMVAAEKAAGKKTNAVTSLRNKQMERNLQYRVNDTFKQRGQKILNALSDDAKSDLLGVIPESRIRSWQTLELKNDYEKLWPNFPDDWKNYVDTELEKIADSADPNTKMIGDTFYTDTPEYQYLRGKNNVLRTFVPKLKKGETLTDDEIRLFYKYTDGTEPNGATIVNKYNKNDTWHGRGIVKAAWELELDKPEYKYHRDDMGNLLDGTGNRRKVLREDTHMSRIRLENGWSPALIQKKMSGYVGEKGILRNQAQTKSFLLWGTSQHIKNHRALMAALSFGKFVSR